MDWIFDVGGYLFIFIPPIFVLLFGFIWNLVWFSQHQAKQNLEDKLNIKLNQNQTKTFFIRYKLYVFSTTLLLTIPFLIFDWIYYGNEFYRCLININTKTEATNTYIVISFLILISTIVFCCSCYSMHININSVINGFYKTFAKQFSIKKIKNIYKTNR